MVWVNTDNPQATLDVNGSLRLGSNCMPNNMTCNASNAGTMMYLEKTDLTSTPIEYQWSLVICIASGANTNENWQIIINYVRYDIMRWVTETSLENLWFDTNNWPCILPKPNARVYPIPLNDDIHDFIPEIDN